MNDLEKKFWQECFLQGMKNFDTINLYDEEGARIKDFFEFCSTFANCCLEMYKLNMNL